MIELLARTDATMIPNERDQPLSHQVAEACADEYDNEFSTAWMTAVAQAWAADWDDPREDIYSIDDGMPAHIAGDA
ncbi:MAG: hypothetical protein L0Y71_19315 [Gemmataceae bacterium]|nr:hypothetical protein [Gemmataceae bacterium]